MRILTVRFKNLNSLVGEWEIDFTDPAFLGEGIFAITGPTGAGKSTILDAICLALYGRTPRLERVNLTTNEIMSRHTGECFAEVTFETQAGRYRCHWSQHRARRKSEGVLQVSKHEIADADTGQITDSKIKTVANRIEHATGMDFGRFTRSMLLAQGGFAAFLQANAADRAALLEQITGTDIYSQISIRVHQLRNEQKRKLDELKAGFAGLKPLSPEEEHELRETINTNREKEATLQQQIGHERSVLQWIEVVESLEHELGRIEHSRQALETRIKEFASSRAQLARADQAFKLGADYASISSLRSDQDSAVKDRDRRTALLPNLKLQVEEAQGLLKSTGDELSRRKQELESKELLFRRVHELDVKIGERAPRLQTEEQKVEELSRKHVALIAKRECEERELQNKLSELKGALFAFEKRAIEYAIALTPTMPTQVMVGENEPVAEILSSYKQQHEAYQQTWKFLREELDSLLKDRQLSDFREELNNLIVQRNQLVELSNTLNHQSELNRILSELQKRSALLFTEQTATQALVESQEHTQAVLTTNQALLESRLAELRSIESLEEARKSLQDGKECPLCGALEHPFALGNTPKPSEIEQQLEQTRREFNAVYSTVTNLRIRLTESQAEQKQNSEKQEQIKKDLHRSSEIINALCQIFQMDGGDSELKKSVSAAQQDNQNKCDQLVTTIENIDRKERQQQFLQQLLNEAQSAMLQAGNGFDGIQRTLAEQTEWSKTLEGETANCQKLQGELKALRLERHEVFGDKDPIAVEKQLTFAVKECEAKLEAARLALTSAQEKFDAEKIRCDELDKSIQARGVRLLDAEKNFAAALTRSMFESEESFLAARLSEEAYNSLNQQSVELAREETQLTTRTRDVETRLASEREKALYDLSNKAEAKERLTEQLTTLSALSSELQQAIGGLQQRLSDHQRLAERQKQQTALYDLQQLECVRWELLYELIGSADGKKFRNFAQNITFEMVISQANRQLQKMTDRYLLVRDPQEELEVKISDHYQAGEIRSTKNLSGGESFIISLALALGLSSMASKNVRVDSLFLDEGFGTLDEEALTTALDTLAGLQQEGKLIGVISHIPALKDRIATQIQVITHAGGRSSLFGPGCRNCQEVGA